MLCRDRNRMKMKVILISFYLDCRPQQQEHKSPANPNIKVQETLLNKYPVAQNTPCTWTEWGCTKSY